MKDITKKLSKASMMFMGTRILLLLADNQALVVEGFTVDSKLYGTVQKYWEKAKLPEWNFYQNQAHLFHLSVVGLECVLVVAFNIFAWWSLDLEKSEIMSSLPERTMTELEDEINDEVNSQTGLLSVAT